MFSKPIVVALVWGLSIAILGGWATNLDAWYHALKEPFWKPPDCYLGPSGQLYLSLLALPG